MTRDDIRAELAALECSMIRSALRAHGWNQTATARDLGCRLSSLRRIIERHPELVSAVRHHGLPQGRPAPAR